MEKINLKYLFSIFMLIILSLNAFAVQVIPQETNINTQNEELKGVAVVILTVFVMGMGLFIFIGLFVWVALKIYNYLTRHEKSKYDFFYKMYEQDLQQTNINRDGNLKKRNWKLLWIFFKRQPIWVNSRERGMEVIGFYNGECYKKENFYLISVYNKIGMFKFTEQILIFPIHLKHFVSKPFIDGKKQIIITSEGVDTIVNSEYYLMPLLFDPKNDGEYLDFSDMIYKNYFEKTTHKDIIKENLQQYREGVIKAVESNPNVHMNRRNENQK